MPDVIFLEVKTMEFGIECGVIHMYSLYRMYCVLILDENHIYRWRQDPIQGLVFEKSPRYIMVGEDYAS